MPYAGLGVHQRRSADGSIRAAAVPAAGNYVTERPQEVSGISAEKIKAELKRRNFGRTSKDEKKQIIKTILDHGGEVVSLVRCNKGEQLADLLKTIFATSKKKL